MPSKRELTVQERALIRFLLNGDRPNSVDLETCLVEAMSDGGMRSLRFLGAVDRKFGGEMARARFTDADGVSVEASLLVDQEGELFELEIWKVDFSALQRLPEPIAVERLEPLR